MKQLLSYRFLWSAYMLILNAGHMIYWGCTMVLVGRTFFNPASTKVFSRFESLKMAMENYTIQATPNDRSSVLQQGGMFVFKGKKLLYARKDEGTGDHAPLDDVFSACNVPVA